MEKWGADLYGNPCRGCGFDWSINMMEVLAAVLKAKYDYPNLLALRAGTERHPDLSWTAAGYAVHLADSLRIWSERLVGAYVSGVVDVVPYDPDLLAQVRGYNQMSVGAVLWSVEEAANSWIEAAPEAIENNVVLRHPTRGELRARDVARDNAHDVRHHAWDVERSIFA
jgi:hypothetical protein